MKKVNDMVNSTSSSASSPSSNSVQQQHLNSLKAMAENAILNVNPQQNGLNDQIPLANLLANVALQQQQLGTNNTGEVNLNDPNATAVALAAILSQQQQQQKQINLPAFSVLQQQQSFNEQQQRLAGLSVPSTNNSSQQQQHQSQQSGSNSMSPSLILNQQQMLHQQQQQQMLQQQQQQQQLMNNSTANQETFIQPILGVAPLGKTPLTKEQNQQLAILDCAYKKLPHPSDTEKIR